MENEPNLHPWSVPLWLDQGAVAGSVVGLLAEKLGPWPMTSPAGRGVLSLKPLSFGPFPKTGVTLGLKLGERKAGLNLADLSLINLHPQARDLDPELLPPPWRLAFLTEILKPALDALSAWVEDKTVIVETSPPPQWGMELTLAFPDPPTTETLTVGMIDQWPWLWEKLTLVPPKRNHNFKWLNIPLAAIMGGLNLPRQDLINLGLGDILIPDSPPLSLVRLHLWGPGALRIALREREGSWVISEITSEVNAMAEHPPTNSNSPGPKVNLSDLELPLLFEVGKKTLTLAELEALTPGSTLPLVVDARGQVAITCHGQKVAWGQLVDLGSTLAVRITRMAQLQIPEPTSSDDKPTPPIQREPNFA
ncbi:MAG: type III secretion system cytoplasmic ring protein SctQ [Deltaproteobacteria bacterium]|jgi:type III secretion system YscQ/HrcQ family protein|nr:type III secretion system cytoplasmic ring protein SctQ [Deltaproteobacteria bacterium]